MKKKDLLQKMDLIDDKLINDANPQRVKSKFNRLRILTCTVSACLVCAVLACALVFIIPNLSDDEKKPPQPTPEELLVEEYSPLELALAEYFRTVSYSSSNDMMESDTTLAPGMTSNKYVEITDNQVEGVIEGDLIKRTESHIFYLRGATLYAYSIRKESSLLVGTYTFEVGNSLDRSNSELYISQDGKRATIFYSVNDGASSVKITSLNIENPNQISLINQISLKGSYLSSRLSNGSFTLFSSYTVSRSYDAKNPSTYIPSIDTGSGYECIDISNIVFPKKLTSPKYTVITSIKEQDLSVGGSLALLSYSDIVYASKDSVYATRQYTKSTEDGDYTYKSVYTEITRAVLTEKGYENKGSISIKGSLKNQYSLDEYNGVLRAVTTVQESTYKITQNGDSEGSTSSDGTASSGVASSPTIMPGQVPGASSRTSNSLGASSGSGTASSTLISTKTNASLYCIDISTMSVIGSREKFAPEGESVQSVRFDKAHAYVCTAIIFQDPVFAFDLSNPSSIPDHIKTPDIEGFSSSLVQLGDGYLLGIGQTNMSTLKLEIYKSEATGIVSVSKYERELSFSSDDYKAYYIDRENGIIGLGIDDYSNGHKQSYLIFKINENHQLELIKEEELLGSNVSKRGVLIDGCFYMLSESAFKTVLLP